MWIRASAAIDTHDSAGAFYSADDMRTLIDKAVSSFDFDYHKPPVLIQHDESGAAQAWVKGLKKEILPVRTAHGTFIDTDVLLADVQDIDPEFCQKLESKKHLPVSAAFYPDGRFRHLAYVPIPAVKGNFEDKEFFTIKFEEGNMSDPVVTPEEKPADEQMPKWASELVAKFVSDIEAAMAKFAPKEKEEEKPKEGEPPKDQMFSEADLERARREGEERAETKAWLKGLKIRPALTAGLAEFMGAGDGKSFSFGEQKDVTPKAFVRQLVDRFSALDVDGHLFTEFATGGATKSDQSQKDVDDMIAMANRGAK